MLVIKIYSNEKWQQIDLAEVTSISLQYNSPMLQFEKIEGDFSLPFTLLKTITNNKIFEYPHRLDNVNQSVRKYPAQLIVNGLLLHSGILSLKKTTDEIFRANIKFNYSEHSELFNTTKINGDFYGGEKNWVWKSEYTDTDGDDFALPTIINKKYYENSEASSYPSAVINKYQEQHSYYIAEEFIESGNTSSVAYPICPQPYLYLLLPQLFSAVGMNITDNFFENDIYLRKLLLFNNNNIVFNEKITGVNLFYLYLTKYNLKQCVPDITISKFILALKNYFCINFETTNNNLKIIPLQNYLNNNSYIDVTKKTIKGKTKKTLEPTNIEINLNYGKDTAPLITDIRKSLKGRFEDLNGGSASSYPLPAPVIDDRALFHDFDTPFLFFFRYQFNKYGLLTWIDENIQAKYHSFFERKKETKKITTFNTEFGFLAETKAFTVTYTNCNLQGNSNLHTEVSPSELKLMIYLDVGIMPPFAPVTSPSATNFIVNRFPPAYTDYEGLSLDMWGIKSVRREYWDTFINWYGNIPYKLTRKINFSLIDIKDFNFTKKYKIGNQLFFVENMKITIDIQGNIKPAICVLIPV